MLASPREAVHRACPEAEEAIKWGMPTFLYRGKILCGLAAFKQHMSFGFWQHEQVMGRDAERGGMGSYGKLREASDLPKAPQPAHRPGRRVAGRGQAPQLEV